MTIGHYFGAKKNSLTAFIKTIEYYLIKRLIILELIIKYFSCKYSYAEKIT
jgi:hypothetical protein